MKTLTAELEKQMSSSIIRHAKDLVNGSGTRFTNKILPSLSAEINNLRSAGVELGHESVRISKLAFSKSLDLASELLPEPKSGFDGTIDNIWTAYAFGASGIKGEKLSTEEYKVLNSIEVAIMNKSIVRNTPQLPKIVTKLLNCLKTENYPWTDFSIAIREDKIFNSRFLAVANSPAFNLRAKANTIEQLLLPMSRKDLKQATLITAITYVMSFDKDSYGKKSRSLNIESAFKTALACQTLATDGFDIDESNAFITAITSFTGLIPALRVMRTLNFDLNSTYSVPFVKRLNQLIALISFQIASRWKLPKEHRVAIKEQATLGENAKLSYMGELLFLGTRVGMSHFLYNKDAINEAKEKVIELVGIDRLAICESSFDTLNGFKEYQYNQIQ